MLLCHKINHNFCSSNIEYNTEIENALTNQDLISSIFFYILKKKE